MFIATRVPANDNATAASDETTSVIVGSLFDSNLFIADVEESDEENSEVEEIQSNLLLVEADRSDVALADSTPKGSDWRGIRKC